MDRVILDASTAMAWAFEDEESAMAKSVFEFLETGKALVPSLFWTEVANSILMGERYRRFTQAHGDEVASAIEELPIQTEPAPTGRVFHEIRSLARQTDLTIYDAVYLDLALREGIPLATLDQALIKAAISVGVPLYQGPAAS